MNCLPSSPLSLFIPWHPLFLWVLCELAAGFPTGCAGFAPSLPRWVLLLSTAQLRPTWLGHSPPVPVCPREGTRIRKSLSNLWPRSVPWAAELVEQSRRKDCEMLVTRAVTQSRDTFKAKPWTPGLSPPSSKLTPPSVKRQFRLIRKFLNVHLR